LKERGRMQEKEKIPFTSLKLTLINQKKQYLKVFLNKNWLNILIGMVLLINILVIYNRLNQKKINTSNQRFIKESTIANNQIENSEFYGSLCPELTFTSLNGKSIDLKDLIGDVIIIRFSRFYKKDLPNLIYLEHLVGKFKKEGIKLIFINSLGKHDSKAINKICYFSSPIIEDDGTITGTFNAAPEETIIVDRDFTIKFKFLTNNKQLISNEVRRRIFGENARIENPSFEELNQILQKLSYFNVLEKKEAYIISPKLGKKKVVTLFTSTCTGCEENYRIQLLKEFSSTVDAEKIQVILLFGIGNNTKAIRQFALLNDWNDFHINVGVINNFDEVQIFDYYKLFQLDIDPRTFIIDPKKGITFTENLKNSRLINSDFLKKIK